LLRETTGVIPLKMTKSGPLGFDPDCVDRRFTVKDVYEILRQKEMDCARLQGEVEALRLVIPLLADENHAVESMIQNEEEVVADKTGTDRTIFSPVGRTEWSFWKRHREAGK